MLKDQQAHFDLLLVNTHVGSSRRISSREAFVHESGLESILKVRGNNFDHNT